MQHMSSRTNHSTVIKHFLVTALALASYSVWLHAASTRAATDTNTVATGAWGGEHVILQVSKNGAEVEFDCAHGQITQAIALDKRGGFDVPGTFTPDHGGPVRRDEITSPSPARYSGHVHGDAMSLTVTVGKEEVGTFSLTRNSHPNLRKCR
jgi:hypothetical protein